MDTRFPPRQYFWMAFIILLTACTPAQPMPNTQNTAIAMAQTIVAQTQMALSPTLTATPTFVVPTPSPFPTQPTILVLTPDAIQITRWREYQTELAKVLLALTERGQDPTIYKDALCEWDIFGQSGQEVYVYAVCGTAAGYGRIGSLAIIYLEPDGSIRQVKLPEPKPNSDMFDYEPFPKDVQEKFCFYFDPFPSDLPPCPYPPTDPRPRLNLLYEHLKYRTAYPDMPPLFVLSVMPMATPTP